MIQSQLHPSRSRSKRYIGPLLMLMASICCWEPSPRAWTKIDSGTRTGIVMPLLGADESTDTPDMLDQTLKDTELFAEAFYEGEAGGSKTGSGFTAGAGLDAGVRVKTTDLAHPVGYVGAYVQGRKNYYNKLGIKKHSTVLGAHAAVYTDRSSDSDGPLKFKFVVAPYVAQTQTWNMRWKAFLDALKKPPQKRKHNR